MRVPLKTLKFLSILGLIQIVFVTTASSSSSNTQYYDSIDNLGKAAKGRLYSLRSKLTKDRRDQDEAKGVRYYTPVHFQSPSAPAETLQKKESRGYSFHHSSADIKNPMFSSGYSSRDFHSRMGKVSSDGIKWKSPDKTMDKYMKYVYKVDGGSSSLNSFNIHQLEMKNGTGISKKEKKKIMIPVTPTTIATTTEKATTTISPQSKMSSLMGSMSGLASLDFARLGQGLNIAMTTVLTQKLMNIIDQEVPQNFLMPLKHLVSSGEKMVEFWDKKKDGRDGEGKPGIVEMFGYGIDQLKRYRDGLSIIPKEDPVANMTSASKAMIQGMAVVKKLTNRVLGYDTDGGKDEVESRGGYDHGGGWGWGGHHVSYGGLGGLDPFALLAALAFGAFLLQLLLTILNTSARSIDVVDLNVPLLMSDYHVPNLMTKMDKIFGTPTVRTKRSAFEEDTPFFNSVVDKLDGMYRAYKKVKGNPACGRLFLCRAAIQDAFSGDDSDSSLYSQLYTFGLGQLSGDRESLSLVKSIKSRVVRGDDVNCEAEMKGCDESEPDST